MSSPFISFFLTLINANLHAFPACKEKGNCSESDQKPVFPLVRPVFQRRIIADSQIAGKLNQKTGFFASQLNGYEKRPFPRGHADMPL
jgi:hypothetical protein